MRARVSIQFAACEDIKDALIDRIEVERENIARITRERGAGEAQGNISRKNRLIQFKDDLVKACKEIKPSSY